MDFVYIDDVVEAFHHAGLYLLEQKPHTHQKFLVSSGHVISLKEVVRCFEDVSGKDLPIVWGVMDYRPREMMTHWHKGITLPGWQAKVALHQGIQKMLEGSVQSDPPAEKRSSTIPVTSTKELPKP